jgi:hypothetical protein
MRNLEFLSIYRLFVGVDVNLAHSIMMRRRMMLCEIIRQILISRAPVYIKLSLFHSVLYPIKAHIHCLCAFLFYNTIAVSCGSGIIRFHWCGGMFVPQFLQCCPEDCSFFGIYKKTAPFSASVANDITCLRTLMMIKIAPFVSFLLVLALLPM